jgi:phosphohistidine phosphatase
MDLILWRHAEAEEADVGEDDMKRPLTAKGERHAERMANWLGRRITDSTRVLVSPALRCQQTAKALQTKARIVVTLGPGASADEVLLAAGWPDASEPALVVGHQPTLSLVASVLLTGTAQPWALKKGAVWWLRHRPRMDDGQVVLLAVQSPECL